MNGAPYTNADPYLTISENPMVEKIQNFGSGDVSAKIIDPSTPWYIRLIPGVDIKDVEIRWQFGLNPIDEFGNINRRHFDEITVWTIGVDPIPESSTFALLCTGLCGIGFAAFRRKK